MVKKIRKIHYPPGYNQDEIIRILQKNSEIRFTDLLKEIGISNPVLSHHLKVLLEKGKIEYEKRGREKFYMLSNI